MEILKARENEIRGSWHSEYGIRKMDKTKPRSHLISSLRSQANCNPTEAGKSTSKCTCGDEHTDNI